MMHEVVRALHAALLVRAVRVVEEAADDELALEIARIDLTQLSEYIGKFLVGFWQWLHVGFQSACQNAGDDMDLTCSVAPHLCCLSRGLQSNRVLLQPVRNTAAMESGAVTVRHDFSRDAEMIVRMDRCHGTWPTGHSELSTRSAVRE
jgi:hypothetical protein